MNVGALLMSVAVGVLSPATVSAGSSAQPAVEDLCNALVAAEAARLDDEPFDPADLDPADLDPAVIEAHNDLIEAAAGACGWPTIPVWSYEYGYDGLDEVFPAETVVFNLDNSTGQEQHKLKIYEVSEEAADMSIPEILERSDWEDFLTLWGVASALPGTPSNLSNPVELTEGRWAAVCPVLVGTTSEMLTEMLETGDLFSDAGDPHWGEGQWAEFSVEN